MPRFNLPKRSVAMIQMWVSLFLIVLTLVFSFMPIIKIENDSKLKDGINDAVDAIGIPELQTLKIPDEVKLSSPKLISSISTVTKIVKVMIKSSNASSSSSDPELKKAVNEVEKLLNTKKGKEDIATALSLAFAVVNMIDLDFGSSGSGLGSSFVGMILGLLLGMFSLFALVVLTLILPLIYIITFIRAAIKVSRNVHTPEKVASGLCDKLADGLALPFFIMLFQCVVPGMTYAFGVVVISITSVIAVFMNFAATRLREYPADRRTYLNIIQGASLVGIVGFMVFFFNMVNSNILTTFLHGNLSKYLANVSLATAYGTSRSVNKAYMVDVILMLIYIGIMVGCAFYLNNAAKRLSCSVKPTKPKGIAGMFFQKKRHDNYLAQTVTLLLVYIIPTYIANTKHYFNDVFSTAKVGNATLLKLTSSQKGALIGALIGIILMILAEAAVIVLKKKLCPAITEEVAGALIGGTDRGLDEEAADLDADAADSDADTADSDVMSEDSEVIAEDSEVTAEDSEVTVENSEVTE